MLVFGQGENGGGLIWRKKRTIFVEGKYFVFLLWWRRKTEREKGKYLEYENIWSTEKKKNGEGKAGKYSEKENFRSASEQRKQRRKIFGEGKYLVSGGKQDWWRKRRKYLIGGNIVAEGGYENESFTMDPKRLGKNWTDQSRRRKHQKYTVQKYLFSDPRPNKQVY